MVQARLTETGAQANCSLGQVVGGSEAQGPVGHHDFRPRAFRPKLRGPRNGANELTVEVDVVGVHGTVFAIGFADGAKGSGVGTVPGRLVQPARGDRGQFDLRHGDHVCGVPRILHHVAGLFPCRELSGGSSLWAHNEGANHDPALATRRLCSGRKYSKTP